VSAAALAQELGESLALRRFGEVIDDSELLLPARAGHFDPQHPVAIQVWGGAAQRWWQTQSLPERQMLAAQLGDRGAHFLIFAALPPVPELVGSPRLYSFSTETPAHEMVWRLRRWCAQRTPLMTTLHGVLLQIYGLGVLLSGGSGMGKSELALDLVSRGHQLIADDAVEVRQPAPALLLGACPSLLHDFMEVRGLGVVNVRRLYGDAAIATAQRLDLIIRLDNRPDQQTQAAADESADRLSGRRATREVLGVAVPEIFLRAKLGHNQRALVEAACRDHWLRLFGHSADEEFIARQQAAIDRDSASGRC
jgi:HPr kinase/phosphorylase